MGYHIILTEDPNARYRSATSWVFTSQAQVDGMTVLGYTRLAHHFLGY